MIKQRQRGTQQALNRDTPAAFSSLVVAYGMRRLAFAALRLCCRALLADPALAAAFSAGSVVLGEAGRLSSSVPDGFVDPAELSRFRMRRGHLNGSAACFWRPAFASDEVSYNSGQTEACWLASSWMSLLLLLPAVPQAACQIC